MKDKVGTLHLTNYMRVYRLYRRGNQKNLYDNKLELETSERTHV